MLHPVAAVVVVDPVDLPDCREVDVAADDAAAVLLFRVAGDEEFEVVDEVHCPLHLRLQQRAERPVGIAERAAGKVHPLVQVERCRIGPVTEVVDPGGMLREMIEKVAVNHQQPAAVERLVDEGVSQLHVAEGLRGKWPQKLVVVARGVIDLGASLEHAEDPADDETRGVVPVERPLQLPAVDDVTDKIEPVGLDPPEKLKQLIGPAEPTAEVQIGKEQRTDPHLAVLRCGCRKACVALRILERLPSTTPVGSPKQYENSVSDPPAAVQPPKPSFGAFMLRSVRIEPTDISARPSQRGGSTTLRPADPGQAGLLPVATGAGWLTTNLLEKSLKVNDCTIRNWMPAKKTNRPMSRMVWRFM